MKFVWKFVCEFLQNLYIKLPVVLYDVFSIPVAWTLAFWFGLNLPPFQHIVTMPAYLHALSVLMIVQMPCYYLFRVYRGLWRYASLDDLFRIFRSVLCAIMVSIPLFYMFSFWHAVPPAVFLLYIMLLLTLLCGARLLVRHYSDLSSGRELDGLSQRVLIVGAGMAAEGLIRDLKRHHAYVPVGMVDDDRTKAGLEVHGVSVLGAIDKLPDLVRQNRVDLIFIAIPSSTPVQMRRIVDFCISSQVPFHTLPSLEALASGRVEVNALRKVRIEDLLGRHQVNLSWDKIVDYTRGKRILLTGGGGSIGSELCRQVASLQPASMLILDNCEHHLYDIHQELSARFPSLDIQLSLTSVTDAVNLNKVFASFKPHVVFHAAAYKHVPLLENQIQIAVQNNILGTGIAAQASVAAGVNKFILISTDKAVNPTSIMGVTKRVAEIYCQNLNHHSSTQFITVRFGNVLGSTGSVVPLFQKQLQAGGPLTVTHPDIERFFMTIPEAAQLILQAMVNGSGGEIFVLDMGEPVKISYLAEQMIRLSGKIPGEDIKIEYVGLRPGEKLYEELFYDMEQLEKTSHEKLLKASHYDVDPQELEKRFRLLDEACRQQDEQLLATLLKQFVPEFN